VFRDERSPPSVSGNQADKCGGLRKVNAREAVDPSWNVADRCLVRQFNGLPHGLAVGRNGPNDGHPNPIILAKSEHLRKLVPLEIANCMCIPVTESFLAITRSDTDMSERIAALNPGKFRVERVGSGGDLAEEILL